MEFLEQIVDFGDNRIVRNLVNVKGIGLPSR